MIILMSMITCLHIFLLFHNLLTGFSFNILQFKKAREGNNIPSPEIYISKNKSIEVMIERTVNLTPLNNYGCICDTFPQILRYPG